MRCPSALGQWHELLREHPTGRCMYQTPEWFAHVEQNCAVGERGVLAVARAGGAVCGIAPLRIGRDSLQFRAAGRTLYRSSLVKVSVLGGQPLLAESRSLYDGLFATLHAGFPECEGVSLCEVMTGSFLWNYIWSSPTIRERYLPQLVEGVCYSYSMTLPPRFSDFLAGLRRKKRYNLGREVRLLREHGQGVLGLERIDSPAAIPGFLDGIAALGQDAKWANCCPGGCASAAQWFTSTADQGFLCSYLLRCGTAPVAGIVGYRYSDTCLVDATLYSRAYARFSPGTVLLHLATEDLIGQGVRLIEFGVGNPFYCSSSTLTAREGASIILWRKNLVNRFRRAAHAGFQTTTRYLRRVAAGMGLWRHAQHPGQDS
ncbi:MAG TPA: GNAT family N-acetyltransferase [Gemmataceae bacterium]|nr:GNAT family N-acetyltransferase [Gemmataceae bacterium]